MAMTVKHSCGHEQLTRIDETVGRLISRGQRTQKQGAKFLAEQIAWFNRNLCPQCYTIEKAKNPNLKPVG